MFTKPRYKTIEQLITDLSRSPKLQEKLDNNILKIRLCTKQ
jgi:hypothetical protein